MGTDSQLRPPDELIFIGNGDFDAIGQTFVRYFVELGGLTPTDRVLDVGCGIGRMALPLTHYLDANGSYEGLDVVRTGVEWCQQHVTPRFPNFRFQLADVTNHTYNPHGGRPASRYVFPYPDASFDFAFLTSVYTHLLPLDLANYHYEVARVLRPGGRCFATYFLLNRESAGLIAAGQSQNQFRHNWGGCRVEVLGEPEAAVAYDESAILRLYGKCGLQVDGPIRYGSWCGRERSLDFQDVIVATRAGPARGRVTAFDRAADRVARLLPKVARRLRRALSMR